MPKEVAKDRDGIWSYQHDAFGDMEIVDRNCPLCDDSNTETKPSRYSLGVWTVKDCRTCGFTYIDSAPDYTALFEQMAWDKSTKVEQQWRESTRPVQEILDRWTRWRLHIVPRRRIPALLARYASPGNVLDLGCGTGGHLEGLRADFVPHGIEISRDAAGVADARFRVHGGYAVNAPCLDGLRKFPTDFFSAATLRSYLEHELHPADVLTALHRVLQPGGVAVVKVPNYASVNRRVMGHRWCGFRHPDHLNYFTPATLTEMARKSGFSTWFGPMWRLPTDDNMWALLRKKTIVAWLLLVEGLGSARVVTELAA